MDFLIAAEILITFNYSILMLVLQSGEPYFDSCTMIIFFLLIGRTLEQLSNARRLKADGTESRSGSKNSVKATKFVSIPGR